MSIILIIAIIWGASVLIRRDREQKQKEEIARIKAEQARARQAQREQLRKDIERDREMLRMQREQEKLEKEREKQAALLAKHEQRMATAESELAFNREQRERLFSLLDIEELERDASIPGGKEWQKHQKKIITLENQIHTIQKRIDKAHADKAFCEKQMEVA